MSRFLILLGVLLGYTALKMSQLWPAHGWVAVAAAVPLFGLMWGPSFLHRNRTGVFDKPWFRAAAWAGSLLMAVWATFVVVSIPLDLISAGVALVHPPRPEALRAIHLTVLSLSTVLVVVGFLQVVRGPLLVDVSVTVPNLPAALRGFTIAQFTDLHVGPTLRQGYVESVVEKINEAGADLVVFTGDLADAPVASLAAHLEPLRGLKARHGVFFVVGNHEYYWGVDEIVAKARELGMTPLMNENARLSIGGAAVVIAGITDPMGEDMDGHAPDLPRAAAVGAKPDLKILLAHRPGVYAEAEPLGFDLQLSGHTHAGQFFPFSLLIRFFHKFYRGLYRHGNLQVYVNPGTGYWGPADRLGVPPEITLLTFA